MVKGIIAGVRKEPPATTKDRYATSTGVNASAPASVSAGSLPAVLSFVSSTIYYYLHAYPHNNIITTGVL